MELWRKHGVNPFKGCLPQMASMPVWFALYTTLQTAVELYNIPFLWFPDLSKPDGFYILPFIIGLTYFAQQKLMPQQGDPMQQKMMMYFMPGMFTVFMLFLPSGLGVYMFTNSLLGIVQHQVVEWHVRRSTKAEGDGDINVSVKEDGAASKEEQERKTFRERTAPRQRKGLTMGESDQELDGGWDDVDDNDSVDDRDDRRDRDDDRRDRDDDRDKDDDRDDDGDRDDDRDDRDRDDRDDRDDARAARGSDERPRSDNDRPRSRRRPRTTGQPRPIPRRQG